MARENCFEVEGVVMEALPNRIYRVGLANGHQVLAFVTGKAKVTFAPLVSGDRVMLEISPYDLSEGRIIVENVVRERKH